MGQARVLVAAAGAIAQVRIEGRATFACSGNLRDFCLQMLDDSATRVVIDLSKCLGMDSTFMGVLSQVALRARRHPDGGVDIVNAADSLKKLLRGLGIHRLFCFRHTDTDDVDWTALCNTGEDAHDRATTMLSAHQTLGEVNPENVPKFKDVVEFLRDDIRRLNDDNEPGA